MSNPNPRTARSVNWWTVHQFVVGWLEQSPGWPMAGSVAWQQLRDDDPRKWASLLDAARHWALRIDTMQEARAEASRAVAAAADWPAAARELGRLREFRSANPWAKRGVLS